MSKKIQKMKDTMKKKQMAQNIKSMLTSNIEQKRGTIKRNKTTEHDVQNIQKIIGQWILQDCAKMMLNQNFQPNVRNQNGVSLINNAINQNKMGFLQLLLENGASSTFKDKNGMTPLGQCLVSQNIKALELILQYPINVEEDQIYDPRVSDHTMNISEYICTLLRIYPFLHSKYKLIIKILEAKIPIQAKTRGQKQIIFKQFAMVFASGKDNFLDQDEQFKKYDLRDFNFNEKQFDDYEFAKDHLYKQKKNVAILIQKFHPDIDVLMESDNDGNNLLHFIAENYLVQTCKKFFATIILQYTKAKENSEAITVLNKLVNQPNTYGITPLMAAFKTIYSSKQVELIKFFVQNVNSFEPNVEYQALNHLLEIMRYQKSQQIILHIDYLKKYISKFENWETVHKEKLILMVKESSSNKQIKSNLQILGIDINVTQELKLSLTDIQKPMQNLFKDKMTKKSSSKIMTDLQPVELDAKSVNQNALVANKVQKTLWDQLHKFGFGQNDDLGDREFWKANLNTNLQFLQKSEHLISGDKRLIRGLTFSATGFKEGTNIDSILTIKDKKSKIKKGVNIEFDEDNSELFESSCDKTVQTIEEAEHNFKLLKSVQKLKHSDSEIYQNDFEVQVIDQGTQLWAEDIEVNYLKSKIEEDIMSKSKVETCAQINLLDFNANFSDKSHIGVPGGQLLQLFYVLDQIKIHFPIGLKTYTSRKLMHDYEYFLEPHEPRELLLNENDHLLTFLIKYLLQMQNESIEILISRECEDYLDEHNGTLSDMSKMEKTHLLSFKKIFIAQKLSLFHQRSDAMIDTIYDYFIDILALQFSDKINKDFKDELKTLQSKIKLIRLPENVVEDKYLGDDEDVNLDTGELNELENDLLRGNSCEQAIVIIDLPDQSDQEDIEFSEMMKEQGEGKSVMIQTRSIGDKKENYYQINNAASYFCRHNILMFIDKTYPELFQDMPEALQQIYEEVNERSQKEINSFIQKSDCKVIRFPIKIDLSGLYLQQTRIPEYDVGNKLKQFTNFAQDSIFSGLTEEQSIFTRCIRINDQQEINYRRLRFTYEKEFGSFRKKTTGSMINMKANSVKKFNKYLEFFFNLVIELIALADLSGDISFSMNLYATGHLGWFTTSLMCMISPFLVCYIPLLAFQELNSQSQGSQIGNSHNSHSHSHNISDHQTNFYHLGKKALKVSFLTPLVLVYMLFLDLGYIVIFMILQIFILLLDQINYLKTGQEDQIMKQNKFDQYYAKFIDITKEDLKGFRRLRTIAQFTFESLPQIFLQIYILIWTVKLDQNTGINSMVILFSLLAAILHAFIEIVFINLEAKACKTTLMHYFIICFNARFDWVPFSDQFSTSSGYQLPDEYSQENLDYEDMNSSLLGQNFKMEFQFTDSTCKALTNCVVNLPITIKRDQMTKNLKLGSSLNQVSINNILELINVSNNRINLDVNGVDLNSVLQRSRETIHLIKYPEYSTNSDSLIEQMVIAGQCQVVKAMFNVGAHMDFEPSLYSLARDNNDFKMLETLSSLEYPELISELLQIENYSCKFFTIAQQESNPQIIASIFLNSKQVVSEQFQEIIIIRIFKYLEMYSTTLSDQEVRQNAFFLLKALCGPEIPFYLLKGEGEFEMDQKIDLHTKHILIKEFFGTVKDYKQKFPPFLFFNSKNNSKILKLRLKFAFYFAKIRINYLNALSFDKNYSKKPNQIILSDSSSLNSENWHTQNDDLDDIDETELQKNLFDLQDYGVDPQTLVMIDKILSDQHEEIGLLSKVDTAKCDHAVNVLCLDKHRDRYFARTRQGDTTKSVRKIMLSRMRLDYEIQEVFTPQNVVVPEFISRENLKVINVIKYEIPDYIIAVKLFRATFSHRNGTVLLNIAKKVHQTSIVISKQQSSAWAHDRYIQKYDVDRDEFDQEEEQQLQNPRGYNDILCSAQAGDTIMLNFIGEEIKDVEVYLELYCQFEQQKVVKTQKTSLARRITMKIQNMVQ